MTLSVGRCLISGSAQPWTDEITDKSLHCLDYPASQNHAILTSPFSSQLDYPSPHSGYPIPHLGYPLVPGYLSVSYNGVTLCHIWVTRDYNSITLRRRATDCSQVPFPYRLPCDVLTPSIIRSRSVLEYPKKKEGKHYKEYLCSFAYCTRLHT